MAGHSAWLAAPEPGRVLAALMIGCRAPASTARGGRCSRSGALVPAHDAKDDDHACRLVDLVHDPNVPDPQAPQRAPGDGGRTRWPRIMAEGDDRAAGAPDRRPSMTMPTGFGSWVAGQTADGTRIPH